MSSTTLLRAAAILPVALFLASCSTPPGQRVGTATGAAPGTVGMTGNADASNTDQLVRTRNAQYGQ